MKWVQFIERADPARKLRLGALSGDGSFVDAADDGLTMKEFISRCEKEPALASRAPEGGSRYPIEEVRLAAPIHDPEKMIFIGLNYVDHASESKMAIPKVPVLFPKFPNSIVGPEDDVVIPAEVKECDYEVELAVVIGKTAKNVSREEALDYVFGYTIVNDVSARDLQLTEGQWTRGKAIDTFAPMGPVIVTRDELADPHVLDLSLALNGEKMQDSNTRHLIFDVPYLISFLSRTITLSPGDVISTGTPPGVGMGRDPQVWLQEGDVTEAYVQGIGTLRNGYVCERTPGKA